MNENVVDETWNLVWARLNQATIQVSVVVTGGGSGALERCFGRAGASKHFVDAAVPYARESLVHYLGGHRPGAFVSEDVARRMASEAQSRTARWGRDSLGGEPAIDSEISNRSAISNFSAVGVALTAVMPTTVPDSQTPPHFWWAVATNTRIAAWHQTVPESWNRAEGERMAQIAVAAGIAWAIDPGFGAEIRAKFPLQSE